MISDRDIALNENEISALELGIESATVDRGPAWQALVGSWQSSDEIKRRFSPGTHGHHEAYDRASVLMSAWSDFIVEHPSVVMSEEAYRMAYVALHFMIGTYQTLAGQEPEKTEGVTINHEEYERLLENDEWASALEDTGVDNWEGYDEALRLFRERRVARADDDAMQHNSDKQDPVQSG